VSGPLSALVAVLDKSGGVIRSSLGALGEDWQGDSWTRPLLDQLVESADGDDSSVHAVAQGWMRIGGTGTPSDAVFVLCQERLGFASVQVSLSDHWVGLADIQALDLLEGLPYPGAAIEVRLAGDRAMLVGWPDWFSDRVVEALRAQLAGAVDEVVDGVVDEPEADAEMPVVASADVEMSRLDDLGPSDFTEPELVTLEPEAEPEPEPEAVPEPEAAHQPDDEPSPEPEDQDAVARSAAMDEFFESPDLSDVSAGDKVWPEPFIGVGYHGGVDTSSRRRKNLTLVLSQDGVSAVASGFGKWSLHFAPNEITGVVVQGPDEVMFTYGVRIGSEASAVVVALETDVAIFEVPDRSPTMLRHDLSVVDY